MEKPGMRFIEFVIATTIGSIVGAYIARDITLDFPLIMRAVFAVAVLAVFFFLVYKVSSSWAKRKAERDKPQIQREHEAFEEEYPAENYSDESQDYTEENSNYPDYPENSASGQEIPTRP